MPVKAIELAETPGLVRDVPFRYLPDSAFTHARNVRFSRKGAEAVTGSLGVLSTASINPIWLQAFPPISNPLWVYADLAQVFVIDGSTHVEITRASGNYTGTPSQRWQAAVFNGVGILNNTIDLPQAWTAFDSSVQLVDLPNWDTNLRAKVIRPFKNYLIALNITDNGVNRPYRVLWSDSAVTGSLPGSWDTTDPATDAREFDLAQTDDYLMDCLPLGNINVIYKENSTWGMSFRGAPNYFDFWPILSGRGLLTRDCVVNIPIGHAVVTQDDIIVHRAQIDQEQSIMDRRMRRWLFSNIDPTNFHNSFLYASRKDNELSFAFPEIGETYATKNLIWNWRDNSIGIKDLPGTPFLHVGAIGDTLIDDDVWN